ncbi:MAG: tRNA (adenosine(37)-N6)-threonylcarbamoyltransferase complex transferase subunit TsaD [Bacteroidota bacterium]
MAYILGIESSCDETAAAIMRDGEVLVNLISSQIDHSKYGGVIPELASRLHQQNIVYLVQQALDEAGIEGKDLSAVAVTQGPGLLGALLVGICFSKSYAYALDVPLIGVNHMEAHILANFIQDPKPTFPFLNLTVSGGHTQLVLVKSFFEMEIIGQTIDDAAGEAFDKAAKLLGLPYPGGPQIDRHAREGDPSRYSFPKADVGRFEFSFSGIKTSLLYLLRDGLKGDPDFIKKNLDDLAASYQNRIVSILIEKVEDAAKEYGVTQVALAGGVSANSQLRSAFTTMCEQNGWQAFIPSMAYCTDNAAMIAYAGYQKWKAGMTSELTLAPYTRG